MAARVGFELLAEIPFVPTHWPGYELKRHQSGKSFQAKVDHCKHYCFRLAGAERSSQARNLLQDLYAHQLKSLQLSLFDHHAAIEASASNDPTSSEDGKALKKSKQSKRRRLSELTCDMIRQIDVTATSDPAASIDTEATWQCLHCDKCFRSEGAVQTHCYMVHILCSSNSGSSDVDAATTEAPTALREDHLSLRCSICDAKFRAEISLVDHMVNKHGKHSTALAKPSFDDQVAGNETVAQDKAGETYECTICGLRFQVEDELRRHVEAGWQPRDNDQRLCDICGKTFGNERAWRQHRNYCEVKVSQSKIKA
jgi:uncharacterized C2H2 Zn-finger protein